MVSHSMRSLSRKNCFWKPLILSVAPIPNPIRECERFREWDEDEARTKFMEIERLHRIQCGGLSQTVWKLLNRRAQQTLAYVEKTPWLLNNEVVDEIAEVGTLCLLWGRWIDLADVVLVEYLSNAIDPESPDPIARLRQFLPDIEERRHHFVWLEASVSELLATITRALGLYHQRSRMLLSVDQRFAKILQRAQNTLFSVKDLLSRAGGCYLHILDRIQTMTSSGS